jgi:hypothetical protein
MAATPDGSERSADEVRRDIQTERVELAKAVDDLREEVGKVADIGSKLRAGVPVLAVGAFGVGFFLAGGIGATARLLARRGREGRERARLGRYSVVDLD